VYAIVDRLPGRWRPPTTGLAGASIVARRVDDLVVLSSLLESVPAASPRTLAVHQDVVASLVDAPAVLPLRYGTAVPVAEFADWLLDRRPAVETALTSVRGCVEMSIKLLRLDRAIVQQLAGSLDGGAVDTPSPSAGDRELQALAEALIERAALPEWRSRPAGSLRNAVAAVAFLVPRVDLAGFLARIAPVASHASGIAVVPTGPWAPYSFVPDLARTAPGRRMAASLDPAGRRAG
jgi:hypothetical protein